VQTVASGPYRNQFALDATGLDWLEAVDMDAVAE